MQDSPLVALHKNITVYNYWEATLDNSTVQQTVAAVLTDAYSVGVDPWLNDYLKTKLNYTAVNVERRQHPVL